MSRRIEGTAGMNRSDLTRSARMVGRYLVLAAASVSLQVSVARANPQLCEAAAEHVSARTGVPIAVLHAIALVETGRAIDGTNRPWPWAVNQAGKSHWFATRAEAERHIRASLDTGARNIDIGCFQINHRWHADGFADVSQMLDPDANALYAARFLAQHFGETGDWTLAAGRYHSRTEVHAARYRALFSTALASLGGRPNATATVGEMVVPRANTFPLLQPGAPQSAGSLIPQVVGQIPGLFSAPRRALIGS
jgi:hypothetical protein